MAGSSGLCDIVALSQRFASSLFALCQGKATKGEPANEDKLAVYGLFKQAKEGDVQGSQPWSVQCLVSFQE